MVPKSMAPNGPGLPPLGLQLRPSFPRPSLDSWLAQRVRRFVLCGCGAAGLVRLDDAPLWLLVALGFESPRDALLSPGGSHGPRHGGSVPVVSSRGIAQRPYRRVTPGSPSPAREDVVAVEEPLEIRVSGDRLAVTMRTPGHDAQLAAGFLLSEGIIRSADDLGTLSHCGRVDEPGYGNVLDVLPAPGTQFAWERMASTRRGTLTTAACGVCGREQIDDLLALVEPLGETPPIDAALVASAPDRLRAAQQAFERTGGTHAAMVLAADGTVLSMYEDVGRHNAVDKAVGALVLASRIGPCRTPAAGPRPAVLAVSGRSSFEMVQKAAVARIPVLASVGAGSSLAVDLAERAGVTLATFVRGGSFNLYTHPERIRELVSTVGKRTEDGALP
jgi:FdhD protein